MAVPPPPPSRSSFSSISTSATKAATSGLAVDFEKGIVWIKWIGTHRDYDRIDVKQVKYEE